MGDRKNIDFNYSCLYPCSVSLGCFLVVDMRTQDNNKKSLPANNTLRIEEKRIKEHIVKLISEDFQGRRAGTQGESRGCFVFGSGIKNMG